MAPGRTGRMLKTLRLRRGYRQIDLAKRAKVTNVYLSQLENGRQRNPSVAVLQRLAKAVRVPLTELLG
jgi:transcriptional regulator with XRE-family HTH domain